MVLGLNPGVYLPHLQARDGHFASEIRANGSYSAWVHGHPYDGPTWREHYPPNGYYLRRLAFTRNWLQDSDAFYNDMLIFEMYPWHSSGITGPMTPSPETIDTPIWQPIRKIGVTHVFAFGAPWSRLADHLHLPCSPASGAEASTTAAASPAGPSRRTHSRRASAW